MGGISESSSHMWRWPFKDSRVQGKMSEMMSFLLGVFFAESTIDCFLSICVQAVDLCLEREECVRESFFFSFFFYN